MVQFKSISLGIYFSIWNLFSKLTKLKFVPQIIPTLTHVGGTYSLTNFCTFSLIQYCAWRKKTNLA